MKRLQLSQGDIVLVEMKRQYTILIALADNGLGDEIAYINHVVLKVTRGDSVLICLCQDITFVSYNQSSITYFINVY